jgi:hypothetical protein
VRLTERDRTLLEFIAEHRLVRRTHVERLLGTSADAASTRLRSLATGGYLDKQQPFDRQLACYQITRRGLAALGSPLPAPRAVDLRELRHDVGLAWLWLAAHQGAFGRMDQVIAERELRSRDGRLAREDRGGLGSAERLGVRLYGVGPAGGERIHYPDLLLRTRSGHRVAVELELTGKGRRRLDRVISGYAGAGRIDAILYLVQSRALGEQVRASARRHGISSLVHVQLVSLPERSGFPARGREAGRSAPRRPGGERAR